MTVKRPRGSLLTVLYRFRSSKLYLNIKQQLPVPVYYFAVAAG